MDPHSRPDQHTSDSRRSGLDDVNGSAAHVGLGVPLPDDPELLLGDATAARDLLFGAPSGGPDRSRGADDRTGGAAHPVGAAARDALTRSAVAVRRAGRTGQAAARRRIRRARATGAARSFVPGGEPFEVDRPVRRGPALIAAGAVGAVLLWAVTRRRR
ncbi:hypothetical protein ACFQMG_01305 [Kitasatospora paranensis]|uniref:DUF3618 domain-containing protein n=1 Tax=Kitasatospora paranensis TaxID=258053 RepID=A0ABW2FRF7_9ACTN